MMYGMSWYPHCVVLERNVYVGGGYLNDFYVDKYGHNRQECVIMKYNLDNDEWSFLQNYGYAKFAMTIINNHLTLVGGIYLEVCVCVTDQLAVYDPLSQDWTYPYHPMPTRRYSPAVVMYDIWLLVAGGCNDWTGVHKLDTIELLNTSTNQWLGASSLPTPCSQLTLAILQQYLYIAMNSKEVYRVSLPDIVSQSFAQSTVTKSPPLWCCLPDTPLDNSAAISLHGYLIAMGGSHDNHTRTDIYLYQPESKQWTKVGDLPTAREYCSCVVLPSGELLVAGGHDVSYVRTSRVDVASVLN